MTAMRVLAIIALCIVLFIVGWKLTYPTYTYRYRLSIAVDVGGETKTASSVIEIKSTTQPRFGAPLVNYTRGEAVFLDLGAKGNVIATLGFGPNGSSDYTGLLVPTEFGMGGLENLPRLETLRGSRDLTGKFIPTLVTFADLNDPESARVVPPDQFQQVFGPDVHFKRAWIEMTTEPVTRGIEQKMPQIIQKLRVEAQVLQITTVGAPYSARLGHFYIGG